MYISREKIDELVKKIEEKLQATDSIPHFVDMIATRVMKWKSEPQRGYEGWRTPTGEYRTTIPSYGNTWNPLKDWNAAMEIYLSLCYISRDSGLSTISPSFNFKGKNSIGVVTESYTWGVSDPDPEEIGGYIWAEDGKISICLAALFECGVSYEEIESIINK